MIIVVPSGACDLLRVARLFLALVRVFNNNNPMFFRLASKFSFQRIHFPINYSFSLSRFVLVPVWRADGAKITNLKVPSTFIVEESNGKSNGLVLDCEYDVAPDEQGFVLKWLQNGIIIYQWIPSHTSPYAMGAMREKIDTNYTVSNDRFHKHRAVLIPNPTHKQNGTYTCTVSSFNFNDKRSADLQIIGKKSLANVLSAQQQSGLYVLCRPRVEALRLHSEAVIYAFFRFDLIVGHSCLSVHSFHFRRTPPSAVRRATAILIRNCFSGFAVRTAA